MEDKKVNSQSDISKLEDLSEVLNRYNLTAVEIFEGEKKYRVEKATQSKSAVDFEKKTSLCSEEGQVYTIFSPIVGVFRESLSENGSSKIEIGYQFKEGDVLCVIEAMKTFTDVLADENGIIKEICASNGDLIEYSQPLFKYVKC